MEKTDLRDKTIEDFGDQWSKYTENEGWYGSLELFSDIINPLLDIDELKGTKVAEIGSGTGRIVNMLLKAGAAHIYAIEPSAGAFNSLEKNIQSSGSRDKVTTINKGGENWKTDYHLDYVFSIGVVHHIPEPLPVIKNAYNSLKEGGRLFIWLYGYEGNEIYLKIFEPVRKITKKLPHIFLRIFVEAVYGVLIIYKNFSRLFRLPFKPYINNVLWPMTPKNRRLVIYDQLNPAYAKYYRKEEAIQLLKDGGFEDVKIYQRHGYSWSVIGRKPYAR